MHFALTVSAPTLVALALTLVLWVWALKRDAYGSMDLAGALFLLVAAGGTFAIWLVRACAALWLGI